MTGNVVIGFPDAGCFPECESRTHLCGYACCKFTTGNWIFLFPGELEIAQEQKLTQKHLVVNENQAQCKRACSPGELKPIDCALYPVFPANAAGTKFIVASNTKCPIPHHLLMDHIRKAQQTCWSWEEKYPGSLAEAAMASKNFVDYVPFPFEFTEPFRRMSPEEIAEIRPNPKPFENKNDD